MFQSGFIKLILVVVIIYLLVKFHGVIFNYMVDNSDSLKNMLTKYEVSKIQERILTDHIENQISFENYYESDWNDYLKKNFTDIKDKKLRDPTKDLWGTEFQLLRTKDLPQKSYPGIVIRSAGPDMLFMTEDDITAYCELVPNN